MKLHGVDSGAVVVGVWEPEGVGSIPRSGHNFFFAQMGKIVVLL